ncbi:MAG: tyrosine-type recombinase/integrase [Alistipes sp.]|nr:tyrosine-type recombinase/integrase [Alistipes sp.]
MIDAFITYIEAEKRYSPLTVRNYRHDLEAFAEWWCRRHGEETLGFDVTRLCEEDMREWIMQRICDGGISAASMNRELSTLRSFMRFMRKKGVVDHDLFKRIAALKTPKRLPDFVPETRMEHVLENLREESLAPSLREQRNALIVSLFYGSGIRLAELHGITLGDLSDGYTTLRVRGKGDKERIIPLLPELSRRIALYINTVRQEGIFTTESMPLIITEQGRALARSTIQRIVGRELRRANITGKASPHILRHTFATHLLNRNADMRDIQELMGHSSLKTTQHYTHNSITQLQHIYNQAHPHGAKQQI